MIEWPEFLTTTENKTFPSLLKELRLLSNSQPLNREFYAYLDSNDPFSVTRKEFEIPLKRNVAYKFHDPSTPISQVQKVQDSQHRKHDDNDEACIYFSGNSLGLMPKITKELISQELNVWSTCGVHGHFHHKFDRPWASVDDFVVSQTARIVGAKDSEISILNSLSVNLHLLLVSFYTPTPTRNKILIESKAFPSDHYIAQSQIRFHGYDPKECLVTVDPRENNEWYNDDILKLIDSIGDQISVVMLSGVQYFTGQLFDIPSIVSTAKKKGCRVGFDLAHAAGNVELKLHDWNVDFAAWCNYKYLNSGPGAISSIFVHENHHKENLPKLHGWWGNKETTRFQMRPDFDPIEGANVYRMSNPNVLAVTCLLGSLTVYEMTSINQLRKKSILLTGLLEYLLSQDIELDGKLSILTTKDKAARGCQLSLVLSPQYDLKRVFLTLSSEGIVCDKREPNCIRVAPVPLKPCQFNAVRFFASSKNYPVHKKINMPALSPTMVQGNIGGWHKKIGEELVAGDILVEIETDKAQMDFECQEEGFLAKILKESGSKDIKINEPIAILVENKDDIPAFADFVLDDAPAQDAPTKSTTSGSTANDSGSTRVASGSSSSSVQTTGNRVIASPLAKKVASELGVDLRSLSGSGPNNRIVKADVINANVVSAPKTVSKAPVSSSPPKTTTTISSDQDYTDIPLTNMRKVIASRLQESKSSIPHYYLTSEITVDKLLKLREAFNEQAQGQFKLSVNDFIVKASALALRQVPEVNSSWSGSSIRRFNSVDISVAVATPAGLITPIITNADMRGLVSISGAIKDLALRARENKLAPQEYQGGTFTISNLGMFGVKQFTAIINPPQSCILAVGSTEKKLIPDDKSPRGFQTVQTMHVTLSCDHRVVDGAIGAQWLRKFKDYLENPLNLLL